MATADQSPGSLPPQKQPPPPLQQNSTVSQPMTTDSLEHHHNHTESGLPPFPQRGSSWTDLTSPEQTAPGQPQQDFSRRQPSCQTNTTKPATSSRPISHQPLPIQSEPHQTQPQPQLQPQSQQPRSQNGVPSALPVEAVLVPHTVGQVGSHVFPIASGQYQIRVISYMEVLIPMVPSPAQPLSQ
ncbi:hypothetical protein PMG11_06950 [Penicillium brasilianum]|uniref:Uncharacterized protein n=1 Tax=Penicillium brasilianum TaxID=104259 RepID=A0A0F7TR29_PENBI|nr:hypothetical protein PMG11_06950 [Penicillium brasilianum]